jgi:hypothetical protein
VKLFCSIWRSFDYSMSAVCLHRHVSHVSCMCLYILYSDISKVHASKHMLSKVSWNNCLELQNITAWEAYATPWAIQPGHVLQATAWPPDAHLCQYSWHGLWNCTCRWRFAIVQSKSSCRHVSAIYIYIYMKGDFHCALNPLCNVCRTA